MTHENQDSFFSRNIIKKYKRRNNCPRAKQKRGCERCEETFLVDLI